MKSRLIVVNTVIAACLLTVQLSFAQQSDKDGESGTDHSMGHSDGATMGDTDSHNKSHSIDQSDMTKQEDIQYFKLGELTVSQAQTRVTPPGATVAAGYLVVTNNGATDDVLLGGSVDFAETTEVHSMEMKDDVMKMRRLKEGLVIPAGKTVELAHGGFHLMFKQLRTPMSMSDDKSLTLIFKEAGELEVHLIVTPLM